MKKQTLLEKLEAMNACADAREWLKMNKITTLSAAWKQCQRGDWMLWYAGKLSGEPESEGRKQLVLAACGCARLALPYAKSPTVLACIETAEAWAQGKVSLEQLRVARKAAYAAALAAGDTAYAAAALAAGAAAYAATAYAAADAYSAAAYADAYAYAAAYAADASNARTRTLAQCADIVRKFYPKPPR